MYRQQHKILWPLKYSIENIQRIFNLQLSWTTAKMLKSLDGNLMAFWQTKRTFLIDVCNRNVLDVPPTPPHRITDFIIHTYQRACRIIPTSGTLRRTNVEIRSTITIGIVIVEAMRNAETLVVVIIMRRRQSTMTNMVLA